MKLFLFILPLLLLSACSPQVSITDCETPMEYLVQSNCPFTTKYYNNQCAVVCPLTSPDYIGHLYPEPCNKDSDCNCEYRGNRTLECACIQQQCYSIEAYI